MRNETITLDQLKIGRSATIVSVEDENEALRARILNMGLTPGITISLIKTAPLGDPMEFRVRGYELTLRKENAAKILIKNARKVRNRRKIARADFEETIHPKIGEATKYQLNTGQIPAKSKIKFALVGNQNAGKTTLFNKLTGSRRRVGNFPGVTIDSAKGILKGNKDISIIDLPGVYSLSPYSKEEIVTRDFILNEKPDGIINIVDAANIERNLLLTMQLIELNVPMVIALNMIDEVRASGGSIDVNGLEKLLGVPVIPISSAKNEGIDELMEHAINVARYEDRPARLDFCEGNDSKDGAIHRCIHAIISQIEDHARKINVPVRFAATKIVENDSLMKKILYLDDNELEACEKLISQMEREAGMDRISALANMRFSFIEKLCDRFVSRPKESKGYKLSNKLDKILTGKYSALPVFICIMAFILYLTFGPAGTFLSHLMESGVNFIKDAVDNALTSYGLNPAFHSLIINGIFAGVGSVLSFLPIIAILFFFLSILEDTGYMARVAFVMDKALRKIGLSGGSFAPMLIGFGCSVPAIMASRTLPSERDRKMTIFLIPFMSCSAKLPIYALFAAAFFKSNQAAVVISLYLIGIVVGLIFAYIIKSFVFKGNSVPFVMELPNYRFPNVANVYRLICVRAKDFVEKAFTVVFLATIAVWFLRNFDLRLNLTADGANCLLAELGNVFSLVFKPIGMADWRISTAFISGLMAKESVVSTLTVLIGGDVAKLPLYFTKLTAFAFSVFSLLYTPCIAAVATVKKELGKSCAVGIAFLQCIIAWLVSFIVYRVGLFIIE